MLEKQYLRESVNEEGTSFWRSSYALLHDIFLLTGATGLFGSSSASIIK